MKNLQEATERICELKGSLVALDALVPALIEALGGSTRARLMNAFDAHAEAARTVLLYADVSDLVLATFERDIARDRAVVLSQVPLDPSAQPPVSLDTPLIATTRVASFAHAHLLETTNGFLFRCAHRLFLVSSRQAFAGSTEAHRPDRVEIGVHIDPLDLTRHTVVSLPLLRDGMPLWRQAGNEGDAIAALEIPASCLPDGATVSAFDESHLEARGERIAVGDALVIACFPAGLHDAVHHLAVARSASIASDYGVRFQGQDCFLTDARTSRGSSGSPVLRRRLNDGASAPSWQLIGVHSTRAGMSARDAFQDETMGLHCARYADKLPALVGVQR